MGKNVVAGVGISYEDDAHKAGKEAVETALEEMKENGGEKPILGIVFCSAKKYAATQKQLKDLVAGVHLLLSDIEWIGCTTAGEISNYGSTEESCVAMVIGSDYIRFGVGISENVSDDPKKAGENAIKTALNEIKLDKYIDPYINYLKVKKGLPEQIIKTKPYSVLMLPPGSSENNIGLESAIISGIVEVVDSHTPIIGGSAGDDLQFKQTYQFANGEIYTDAVITIGFVYDVVVNYSTVQGCIPSQEVLMVTEADGKIVKKLGDKPASEAYAELIGKSVEEIKGRIAWIGLEYPFGMCDPTGQYWVKSPQASLDDSSLMFFADIPEKTLLTLMKSDKDKVLSSAYQAVEKELMNEITKEEVEALIVFDCAGRKNALGESAGEEIEKIKKLTGNAPMIGFYTYGEQGFGKNMPVGNFNLTLTAQLISDNLLTD